MKISELEKISGFSRDTIRYYERLGLLSSPSRDMNSYRIYTDRNVKELNFIKRGKEIGFSLDQIKTGVKFFITHGRTCNSLKSELVEKKAEIELMIQEHKHRLKLIEKLLK